MAKHLLPSFMIIGGVKCGTSSLYRYLNEHPQVLPCKTKEPNYFSFRPWYQIPFSYARYKKLFPLAGQAGKVVADWLDLGTDGKMHASQFRKTVKEGLSYITGEATATTFFAANPRVIKFLLPKVKCIMMLRNPTERYLSQYRMYERFKKEGRKGYDFKPLLEYIEEEIDLFSSGKKTRILHQGLYAYYLRKWVRVFGEEEILWVKTQDFETVSSARQQMAAICQFLDLPEFEFPDEVFQKFNRAAKRTAPIEAVQLLDDFYKKSLHDLEHEFSIVL